MKGGRELEGVAKERTKPRERESEENIKRKRRINKQADK